MAYLLANKLNGTDSINPTFQSATCRAAARKDLFTVSNAIHGFAPPDNRLRLKAAAWWSSAFILGAAFGAALLRFVQEVIQ